jgi:hypothetical protein
MPAGSSFGSDQDASLVQKVLRRVAGLCLEQAATADIGHLGIEKAQAYFHLAEL